MLTLIYYLKWATKRATVKNKKPLKAIPVRVLRLFSAVGGGIEPPRSS